MVTKVMGNGITVVSSPSLDLLTDELAEHLGLAPSDPFSSELIVVPNIGVRDWLQRELSGRLDAGRAGIVANVRFMFVQQFLDTVFTASGASSVETWNIEHLTWVVHRAIDRFGRLSIPGAVSKPLTVARLIADLFDRYGVHRPSMLRYWRNGRAVDAVEPFQDLSESVRWQQRLYADVCELIAEPSPSERLAGLEERVRVHGLSDLVPERLVLFGFSSVNATVRAVLGAVGTARDCHVYLLHPVRRLTSNTIEVDEALTVREHVQPEGDGNPLLSRWGRSALETTKVLPGRWTIPNVPAVVARSDLDRLRQAIVENAALSLVPIDEDSPRLAASDGSLQIHACHGRVRQVEVLRDALLHLLEDDPTLTLDDISVQCPDLVSFAPIIPAIFRSGQPAAGVAAPPLDVSVADRVLTGENPHHDAFWSLLELAQSRCGVTELMGLVAASPIRRRFDIDDEDLARLADWFDSLDVRFGLDTDHRRRWGIPTSIGAGTWDSALDRLFMGLAVPALEPFPGPGGVVPHDDISVSDAGTLARISDFLTHFRQLVGRLEEPQSVDKWIEVFASVIDTFFDVSEARDYACRDLLDACSRLRLAFGRAGVSHEEVFVFDEIAAILADLVQSSSSRPRLRTGAITVTELLPQQGVPYRVIALLGVSEAMFASGGVRGDDALSLRPCIGDPIPSVSGRQQLLNVLLAAKDSLVITCDGADINNNNPIPLPVPVQELLEAMAAIREEAPSNGSVRVFTRHPRQSYSPRSLSSGHFRVDRPFTFDPVALELHGRKGKKPEPVLASILDGDIPSRDVVGRDSPDSESVDHPTGKFTCDSLRKVLAKPTDFFVQDLLGVRLPSTNAASSSDYVDFWPSNLDMARAGRELLDSIMRNSSDPSGTVDRFLRQIELTGSFPPGRLGTMAAQQLGAEVLSIFELLPESARHHTHYRSVELDEVAVPSGIGGGDLEHLISGVVDDVLGFDVVRASFTRLREDLVLEPWIDLALLGYVEPEHPWSVRLVARGSKGEAKSLSFGLAGADAQGRRLSAERAISVALSMMRCMSHGRVPFLPKTSEKLSHSSVESTRSTYEDEGLYSPSFQFLFGRVTWDDFIAEKPRDFDPDPSSSSRAQMFAYHVWNAFRETTSQLHAPWGES